ncbi:hypothetical protein MAMC_01965 [Methylacidimicrobium cyclopophantes]|uniref:TonB C-terminal domain-containing protein n=1 Tax=Methylacidimicrobium cyclopophantes TaxID=1041766 RepID=A0A5E6MF07_9BACT|nr:energy transducer TonB [Methylacidimicrobium cyclopophantes]VVM08074.1 hypothetical protein MAMC_01965 [Methylacidimicrobium cyclopophantes]
MTTTLLEQPAKRSLLRKRREGGAESERPAASIRWPSLVLAILFHAGLACLVLPGVPGSPLPAIAPLSPRSAAHSTSVELVEEAPAPPSAGMLVPEERKNPEPTPLPAIAQPAPKSLQASRKPVRHSAARPSPARHNRAPELGGGLVLSEPPYPYEARRQRLEGKVTLQVFVEEGRVVWVEILGSSGHTILDGTAKQWALHRWHFPGIAAGAFTEAVVFSLDGA